jgi:hypothetical protein
MYQDLWLKCLTVTPSMFQGTERKYIITNFGCQENYFVHLPSKYVAQSNE